MVLLSALSSEYFLTWLLNMLWAGTWHRTALASKVLVLFQTTCHCAWLHSAPEEGETELSGGATLHPGHHTALQSSSSSECSQRWAGRAELRLWKAGDHQFLRDVCWARGCFMLCCVQAVKLLLLQGPAQPLVLVLLPARTCVGSPRKGKPAQVSQALTRSFLAVKHQGSGEELMLVARRTWKTNESSAAC